jgi:hypothetical protein
MGLYINDVYQVAMLIQGDSFQTHLDAVMMRVPFVFRPPVAANKEMLRNKISTYGNGVHNNTLLLGLLL